MLKNTLIKGVNLEIWQFEGGCCLGRTPNTLGGVVANDLGVVPKIAKIRTTITSTLFARMGHVRSLLASLQKLHDNGLVA